MILSSKANELETTFCVNMFVFIWQICMMLVTCGVVVSSAVHCCGWCGSLFFLSFLYFCFSQILLLMSINFLPLSFKETDLMRVFQDVGPIKSVRIMKVPKALEAWNFFTWRKLPLCAHPDLHYSWMSEEQRVFPNIFDKIFFGYPFDPTQVSLFFDLLPSDNYSGDHQVSFLNVFFFSCYKEIPDHL